MNLSIVEASKITGVSQKTIRRHIAAEKLVANKESGSFLIKEADLQEWSKHKEKYKREINSSEIDKLDNFKKPIEATYIDISDDFKTDFWSNVENSNIKFADFFAGAGGLSTGFVMAGFKPTLSLEVNPFALQTHNHNIGSKFGINDTPMDITNSEVKKEVIKKLIDEQIDLIIGGFPCQGFSMAGNRVVEDDRNKLYSHMLDIVKKVKPKVVVMENVTGLRSMLDGKVEKKIITDYVNAGYKISVEVLSSADYKVPQIRKRVIFIANRIHKDNLYPKPILTPENYVTVKDAIGDLLNKKENESFNHEFTSHSDEMKNRLLKIKEGSSLYKGYSDAWKKVHWDKPSPTVKENHGGVFVHPKKGRVMTARELARLQSFPDDFIFQGSKKWQLVQIGNAVPPLLGKAIALSVKKMLTD